LAGGDFLASGWLLEQQAGGIHSAFVVSNLPAPADYRVPAQTPWLNPKKAALPTDATQDVTASVAPAAGREALPAVLAGSGVEPVLLGGDGADLVIGGEGRHVLLGGFGNAATTTADDFGLACADLAGWGGTDAV
jgi:hypothetical protein